MSIQFSCPYCGKQTNVDDQYAGQSGPCAGCGKTISIPGKQPLLPEKSGYPSPSGAGPMPVPRSSGFPVWVILLIVGAVSIPLLCVLPALLLPAIQAAREAANRAQCKNNLRQLALAFTNYHDMHGELPPRYIPDASGRPMHSWRVLILPYLNDPDAQRIYDQYNFDEPWDSFHNRMLQSQMPRVFQCPTSPPETGITSYVVIAGENAALRPAVPRSRNQPWSMNNWKSATSFGSLVDGTANTVAVVEAVGLHVNWLEPVDLEFDDAVAAINHSREDPCVASWHPGGANVAFFDAHVQFLSEDTPVETLRNIFDCRDGNWGDFSEP